MTGLSFDLRELASAGERFVNEVNTALEGNPEIADYVRRLEAAVDSGEAAPPLESSLPAGEELLSDIEDFLRQSRPDEDDGQP